MMHVSIGGCLFPGLPRLIADAEDSPDSLREHLRRAAAALASYRPQTIVVLAPGGAVLKDSIGLYAQPRLKGSLANFGFPEAVLGFETDNLLLKAIFKRSDQLGVNIRQLTDETLAEAHLSAELSGEALCTLHGLVKAGYKGQIVMASSDSLPLEEMFTFGKAVRLAAEASKKRTAVVAAGALPFKVNEAGAAAGAIRDMEVKALLEMGNNYAAVAGMRGVLFLLGALRGSALDHCFAEVWEVDGICCGVGAFFNMESRVDEK